MSSPPPTQTVKLAASHSGLDTNVQFVDLQFTDVTGTLKSVVLPARQLAETLDYGHWFDGSALEGAARSMETDLLLRPDLSTWAVLPWLGPGGERTARVLCDVQTPDETPFPADPRAVLRRVLADAADTGYEFHAAAEVEFFLFRGRPATHAPPAGGRGSRPADRGGYFDLSPESDAHFRDEVVQTLDRLGVAVEASHHEIGPGQHELDLPLLPALRAADAMVTCKYAVKTVARRRGLSATFMPKPLPDVAGSGLHLAQVLLDKDGRNALAEPLDEHGLSRAGRAFIAGQLAHARAMCAVLAPSVNSYKRLGRGFDAPSSITWGHANPLAAIRVPRAQSRRQQHVELRCPDPSCNPYLALAVALAAGLDGIRQNLDTPPPVDAALASGLIDESQIEVLPASLGEALQELEWDPVVRDALGAPVNERLLMAREREWQEFRRQVSPWELDRYFESA
ncbi:MAG TPA: glutamine synthetase family protein [Chloroflexota bacterium]|nr:glutamine synthetase family protein [Chloroflexota bacterium]